MGKENGKNHMATSMPTHGGVRGVPTLVTRIDSRLPKGRRKGAGLLKKTTLQRTDTNKKLKET